MGQADIYALLSRSRKPLTQQEIAIKLNKNKSTINHAINRLLKFKEIKFKVMKIPPEKRKWKAGNYLVRAFYV